MLIVVRHTNGDVPDLFYFAEHPNGNVLFEGQRFICLCAYSATIDYSQIPDEYRARPWEWSPKGYRVAPQSEEEIRRNLRTLFVKPTREDEFTMNASPQYEAMVDSYLKSARIVEYSKFSPKVEG